MTAALGETPRSQLDVFFDRGVMFCSADGGCLGLIWYVNDP